VKLKSLFEVLSIAYVKITIYRTLQNICVVHDFTYLKQFNGASREHREEHSVWPQTHTDRSRTGGVWPGRPGQAKAPRAARSRVLLSGGVTGLGEKWHESVYVVGGRNSAPHVRMAESVRSVESVIQLEAFALI